MTDDVATRPGASAGFVEGAELPVVDTGPLTLPDFVRWAGYQENWIKLHYDASFADERLGQPGVIQSGHHRTALMTRMVTDWLGSRGWLRRLEVRHTGPVRVGDAVRCEGRVRQIGRSPQGMTTVEVDLWAIRQDGCRVSEGAAVVEVGA
jgi:acyl dehydratase